jgi:hypothetical protein
MHGDQPVCCFSVPAHLDVRYFGDGEHAAYEETGQHIVVVHILTQPHLDLQQYTASIDALL